MFPNVLLNVLFGAEAEVALRTIITLGLAGCALLTMSLILIPRNLADWCCAALLMISTCSVWGLTMNRRYSERIAEIIPISVEDLPKAVALIVFGLVPESNTKHHVLGFFAGLCFQTAASILLLRSHAPHLFKGNVNADINDIQMGEWNDRPGLARAVNPTAEPGAYANLSSNYVDQNV